MCLHAQFVVTQNRSKMSDMKQIFGSDSENEAEQNEETEAHEETEEAPAEEEHEEEGKVKAAFLRLESCFF